MDMMSDFNNLDIMIGNENNDPIERELANIIGEFTVQYDIESNPHPGVNSPKKNLETLTMETMFLDKMKF